MPRICLIHAVEVAMPPVRDSLARLWPQCEAVNLLDDGLGPDRERDGVLTAQMSERIAALGRHGLALGARGILYTCSAFGPAIAAFAADHQQVPVLKPNQAMFEEALRLAPPGGTVGLLATFEPSVAPMSDEFAEAAAGLEQPPRLRSVVARGALAALKAGRAEEHDRLVAEAAPALADADVLCLAHFSTARAAPSVARLYGGPILTSPDAAVRRLRAAIEGAG